MTDTREVLIDIIRKTERPRDAADAILALFTPSAGVDPTSQVGEADRLKGAMLTACDLLAERIHGNAARSPGHNARVVLEHALAALKAEGAGHE